VRVPKYIYTLKYIVTYILHIYIYMPTHMYICIYVKIYVYIFADDSGKLRRGNIVLNILLS